MLLVLPLRLYAFKRTRGRLQTTSFQDGSIYRLPWLEFRADLLAWLFAGVLIAALYLSYFKAPVLTGVKVMIGCISFGLFGGMLNYLAMEGRIIALLKTGRHETPPGIERVWTVSSKMLFFMVTVLLFMVLVILLMIFMDIDYLLTHKDVFGPEIYVGVFKEILFAFGVLLLLSLIILGRYSRNLRQAFAIQVRALESIESGDLEIQVPVVSNDEFGQIAVKTNDMIRGLREREFCRLVFGQYVSPEVSEKILNSEITTEGEICDVTILFCDLRGYTTFVEKKDPKEVVKFLNTYFSEMEKVIKACGGIVLQYIGDEIEAVFGAPIHAAGHPQKAVTAALAMRESLANLNMRRREAGGEIVTHGIGIHTGSVLAGSVGSPQRLVYTMVGDAVNTASRIQALNKTFGTDILVSVTTREQLTDNSFELVSLGEHPIRGKSEGIEIFRVV